MIKYVKGDATAPQAAGPKVIAHICNDRGGWGMGFVLAVSKRWKDPEMYYRRWFHSKEGFGLGEIQVVGVEDNLWVANMVAQRGYRSWSSGPPIRYEALEACLRKLAAEADVRKASIHMPRIGTGLRSGRLESHRAYPSEDVAGFACVCVRLWSLMSWHSSMKRP